MNWKFCTSVLIALCSFACTSTPKEKPLPAVPQRVLFIGNEITDANAGIPNALNRLSHGSLICVGATADNRSLAWHWTQGNALTALRNEHWDYVVLQDEPQQIVNKPDIFSLFVRRFDGEINRSGAKTVLFVPFPPADRLHLSGNIFHTSEDAAATIHATQAPVGEAFEQAAKQRPDLKLYQDDKTRPSQAGTYLAACVFYMTVLDRAPVGLDSFVTDPKGSPAITLNPEDAKFLQKIAAETVLAERGLSDPEIEALLKK